MRIAVLGALALTSGCNWVFGLDAVRLTDAQINDAPPDARLPTVKLSAISPMLDSSGVMTGQAIYAPITPAPVVQYGRRGEALVDTVYLGEEVPVGYDLAESTETWRLVYTLAGGIPHEVHWKPSVTMHPGHAVVLQLAPNERDPAPATGTFTLDATNAPTVWAMPRLYTTNTWTLDASPPPDGTIPSRITSNFAGMFTRPIAGSKRKPDPVKDFEVLLDYDDTAATNRCTVVKGSASFHIDLSDGSSIDAVPPTFLADPKPGNNLLTGPGFETIANLAGANGLALGDITRYQVVTYGPGGGIPLHQQTETDVPLPIPVGILLAKCTDGPDTVPTFGYPSRVVFATTGTVMYATSALSIADGGPSVRNGLETSIVGSRTPSSGPFNADFSNAAFATEPTVDTTSVNITGPGTVLVPPGAATAALDFSLSVMTPIVDLYEATLYRVDGAALTPIREFTFTEKPLLFNRDQGQPAGTHYVFAIRVIRGASASAVNADFSVWGNTQWLGVTHTQAFTLE